MQSEFRHTTHHDFRERAKLESKHSETEEEHLSQPSTMHSLGNLEEHSSPIRGTPKSSKHQFGYHIKHEVQVQIGSVRHMLRRVFGEKVDTARDNDQKTKQAVKKVNQEILQRPKRNERVIESIGKGSGKEITSHRFPSQGFGKITEIRDKVARYMPQVRESAHLFVSVARSHLGEIRDNFYSNFNWADSISPSTDLSPRIKEQLNRVNEDIRQLPRRNERVIESMGQAHTGEEKSKKEERPVESHWQPQETFAEFKERTNQSQSKESESQSKKPGEQELWDMAFHKIEEMKEKAHQKGQEFKHEAEKTSQQAFGRSEGSGQQRPQGVPQDIHHLHHEHHHLSAQSPSFEPHHLSAQSPSFQSTEHSKELAQTVNDNTVPLTKKVEEVESHWKHEGQGQSLKQGAQEMKSKISEKAGEIKQSIQQPKEREPLLDKVMSGIHAMSDNIHLKESFKVEERTHDYEPLLDQVMHKISENVRHKKPSNEQQTEEKPDEKDIASMLIRNLNKKGIQSDEKDIAKMLVHNLDVGKDKFPRGKIEEITFTLYEDHSIKERIQERIHKVSDKIRRRKSVGDVEEITFTLYEDHSIKERFQEKIHNASEKILRRKSAGEAEEITFTLYEDHSLKGRIEESIHHISDKIQNVKGKFNTLKHDMPDIPQGQAEYDVEFKQKSSGLRKQDRNLKDFITRKQEEEDPEGYHKVASGFSKSVQEHLNETRYIGPLKSQNIFESLGDVDEADEPENLTEVLPDQPYDISESQSLHSLPHRIKESLMNVIREIKSKLVGLKRRKKSFEELHPLVPMEVQKEEEEYEEEPQFEDDEHPSKIRQSLEELSSKISHDIDVVKGKFRSKKQGSPKIQEKKETLKEKVLEEGQPISQKIQSIKQDLSTTKQTGGIGLQQTKRQKKKAKTPKSASKALKEKRPRYEEFHDVVSGFSKSVAEFKKELRGPPLVSSNPFGGLVAGAVLRRKVSFQEPQQQKKKVFRLSHSAGKEAKKKRFEDFHRITSGFSESVAHFQREVRGDPLISDNPFEPLTTRNVKLIQPLDHNQLVGGHLDELTAGVTSKTFNFPEPAKKKSQGSAKKAKRMPGADITNQVVGESHVKALIQKTKEEIHDASHQIAGKIHHAKNKIRSVFHAKDKENVAQAI